MGFDDSAKKVGRVDCRVFADDKELYANPDLRADGPPIKLALPVASAKRLRLVVDYGANQDTGDRVIWANARICRKPSANARDFALARSPRLLDPTAEKPMDPKARSAGE